MKKTRDYVAEYPGGGPAIEGLCGVRIYEEAGERPVVAGQTFGAPTDNEEEG